jgi:ribosomal-protein-alanine N-acetyltransferase
VESERLTYAQLRPSDLDAFHGLVRDDHVRRYLLDGELLPPDWSEQRIRESQRLFERRGVGIWLASEKATGALAGFCGFLEAVSVHPEPELVYALRERFTGKGYATEMARAAIVEARTRPGFDAIFAAVDEVNAASVGILDKLGFQRTGVRPGHFGAMLLLKLSASAADPQRKP